VYEITVLTKCYPNLSPFLLPLPFLSTSLPLPRLPLPLQILQIEVPNIPHDTSKGVHSIPFDHVIYIDQSDFREVGGGNNCYPDYMPASSRSCRPPFSPLFCHIPADAHSPHTLCDPHFTRLFLNAPHSVHSPHCTDPILYTPCGTIRSSCLCCPVEHYRLFVSVISM